MYTYINTHRAYTLSILCGDNKAMFTFKHPTTILIAGPTQCGKTYFFIRALTDQLIQPPPERIVWVFSEWQPAYQVLAQHFPKVEFVKNFNDKLYESFDPATRNLVVLDDQMENQSAHKRSTNSIVKFFTQGSHHRNLTVVYIVQNLFNQDTSMRTVSLNAHYIIVFKNPRDGRQIHTLAGQMFPGDPAPLLAAFKDATRVTQETDSRGYLTLDLHPTSCDAFRLLTDVFDAQPTVYVPSEYISSATALAESADHSQTTDGPSTTVRINRRATTTRRIGASPHSHPQPRQASRKEHHCKANRQVPQRLLRSTRVQRRGQSGAGRRNQSDL